jgi:hypothetical protein
MPTTCATCGGVVRTLEELMQVSLEAAAPLDTSRLTASQLCKHVGAAASDHLFVATVLAHHTGRCLTPIPCPGTGRRLGADIGFCPVCLENAPTEPVSPRHPRTLRFAPHSLTAIGVDRARRRRATFRA